MEFILCKVHIVLTANDGELERIYEILLLNNGVTPFNNVIIIRLQRIRGGLTRLYICIYTDYNAQPPCIL